MAQKCSAVAPSCILKDDDHHRVSLHPTPFSPGTATIVHKTTDVANGLFGLDVDDFVRLFGEARHVAGRLCTKLGVQRCALVSDCGPGEPVRLKVIPLHGLCAEWRPIVHAVEQFHARYPGFISSHNGPRMSDDELTSIQERLRPSGGDSCCNRFDGDPDDRNLFARIVRGEEQQWRVWEDDDHVAFLTPFPNAPGFTVLVPRRHLSSDIFSLTDDDYDRLVRATHAVGRLLCRALPADSCGVIFEGYEIDYTHVKIIPMVRDCDAEGATVCRGAPSTDFCDLYKGYVTSVDGPACPSDELLKTHAKLVAD